MIDVSPAHLEIIEGILTRHVPDCEVRVYGSRCRRTAKAYSDLDLAIVCSHRLSLKKLADLRLAFEESELPYRVDLVDWRGISEEFKKVIEDRYEVIQYSKIAQ